MSNENVKVEVINEATEVVQEKNLAVMPVSAEDAVSAAALDIFNNPTASMFSSIPMDSSREDKVKLFNAINSSENSLTDYIGQKLEITDMVAHPIKLADMQTGEIRELLRIVLIDTDGMAFSCVSEGVANSLQKIISIFGQAPWEPALTMSPKEIKTKAGFKVLTIELA